MKCQSVGLPVTTCFAFKLVAMMDTDAVYYIFIIKLHIYPNQKPLAQSDLTRLYLLKDIAARSRKCQFKKIIILLMYA